VSGLQGLVSSSLEVVQEGSAPVNFSFPEQQISLRASSQALASLGGGMTISFRNVTTAVFPVNATASEMRDALMDIEPIGEIEVFRTEIMEGPANATFAGLLWTVRFYADGNPPHMGPQPDLVLNLGNLIVPSTSSGRRRLQLSSILTVSTVVTASGSTPGQKVLQLPTATWYALKGLAETATQPRHLLASAAAVHVLQVWWQG
jgi:hypothetical protein